MVSSKELGRWAVYVVVDALIALYLFTFHFMLFDLPIRGSLFVVAMLLLPYLLAVVLLAALLGQLFRRREDALSALLWSSIPMLMLSGISLPREALPGWLYELGNLLPSSPAVRGFVRAHTMGASLAEIRPEILHLWLLTGLYGGLLLLIRRQNT